MPKAKVNEININYKVEGNGEPLVMIMGLAAWRYCWLFQTRVFKKHYQVITFDNRGVGKTDKPVGPYAIKMMADDTIGLMDYLAVDKAHILGVSTGGMIAQELAINCPERVQKLVLGSTLANEITSDEVTGLSPELLEALEPVGMSSASNRKALSTLLRCTFNNNNWLWRMISPFLSWILFMRGGTKGFVWQYEAGRMYNALDRLHMIEAPTLVITGTADRAVLPGSSEVLASRIPNARLVKIENGSHALVFEMRGKFNQEVLDFLRTG